jgi:S1-C subfamily serine protease
MKNVMCIFAFLVMVVGTSSSSPHQPTPYFDSVAKVDNQDKTVKAINTVIPGVVKISFGNSGIGTGVVIHKDGYIITANHVVSKPFTVSTQEGTVKSTLILNDEDHDLALIKADIPEPVVAKLNNCPPKVGETVICIGHPYGYTYSATRGIISALQTGKSQCQQE